MAKVLLLWLIVKQSKTYNEHTVVEESLCFSECLLALFPGGLVGLVGSRARFSPIGLEPASLRREVHSFNRLTEKGKHPVG